jgi:hypothetical protein
LGITLLMLDFGISGFNALLAVDYRIPPN